MKHVGGPNRPDVMMIGLRSIGGGQGGVERHVACLVEAYDEMGLKTCVVVRSAYATTELPRQGHAIEVRKIWAPRHVALEAPVHSVLATIYAAYRRPQVLHIHAIGPSLVAPLARLLGLRVVCTHHGSDYDREKWGGFAKSVLKWGEICQARFAHQVICVSRSLSRQLTQRYGRSFHYLPNGVTRLERPASFELLEQFGLLPGRYIVNVSRIVPEKRQLDLIEAYKVLGRPDLKLALVGGADHVSQYSRAVTEMARATPGVVLCGFQQGEALRQLLGAAAVFALPSTHEGMPIAALEAMGMGRPVVLSDIAPNLDLELPAECYHEAKSVESLAQRLRDMLNAFGDGANVPEVDWGDWLGTYSWPSIARQTVALYGSPRTRLTGDAIDGLR